MNYALQCRVLPGNRSDNIPLQNPTLGLAGLNEDLENDIDDDAYKSEMNEKCEQFFCYKCLLFR
jgi:hypothetical protein